MKNNHLYQILLKASLFGVGLLWAAQAAQAATYYVSKSGSDSNAGTSTNAAYLTISKAAAVMVAGDTCEILSGTYRETVTPANSGTSAAPITFEAYPNAIPIISGADVLSLSWSVYSGSIYQANTTNVVNQLFCDGIMQNIARWPNAQTNNLVNEPQESPTSITATSITDNNLPSGLSLVGAYAHIFDDEFGQRGFSAETRQITGWNSSTKTFTYSSDGQWDGYQTGNVYYVYGALSLLDIATEWYETSGGTLYLWAPDSASPATHVIETKNRTNAFTLDNRSYVTIRGLYVFAAGISMLNTIHCVVNDCDLLYVQHNMTADWDLDFAQANQVSGNGSQWLNSVVQYSSQDGIRLFGTNEVVSNCVVLDVDYYPGTYYAGISPYVGGTNTKVIGNTVWYSGRYAVGVSSSGDTIASNDLAYADILTSDGGATYEYTGGGVGNGTTIHHNWAHNSWAGVYVDQNQSDYAVYCNVCYSNYVGLVFNSFSDDIIINNTSVSNTDLDILCNGSGDTGVSFINNIWNTSQNTFSGGTIVTDNGWYPPIGPNYVPETGSGAINGGEVYAPYTDGYTGSAPDIGAFVGGSNTYWTPGANFTPQPFPLPENTNQPPYITTQPQTETYNAGQTAEFSVVATGSGTLHYQWRGGSSAGTLTNLAYGGGQYSPVTNANLYITNVMTANAIYYAVVVSNAFGSVTSSVVALNVIGISAPTITIQPTSQTNTVGQTATFTVSAGGTVPLSYQWRGGSSAGSLTNLAYGGGQYSPVTSATLYITNVSSANAGYYAVVITNAYGSITSSVVTLTVNSNNYASTIETDHPTSYWPLNETSGTTIHDVVGTNNGTAMNTSGLTLGAPGVPSGGTAIYFTNADSGYIQVPYSSLLNTPQLTVEVWLNMPTFPVSGSGANMNAVSFDNSAPDGWTFDVFGPDSANPPMWGMLANTSAAFTYDVSGTCIQNQWSYYAMTYNGTTFSVYTNGVLAVSASSTYAQVASGTEFFIGAYNDYGNNTPDRFYQGGMQNVAVYSNALSAARILVHYTAGTNTSGGGGGGTAPSITTQPATQTDAVGQTASFTVVASGTAPLTYQWRGGSTAGSLTNLAYGGGQYSPVTNATLYITNLSSANAGYYAVVVANAYGSVTSAVAQLTVDTVPSITTQPADQTNTAGQTATFTVVASGTAPLSYQWRGGSSAGSLTNLAYGGGQYSPVTNANLYITNVSSANALYYAVVVNNAVGAVTSSVVTLTVNTAPSITTQPANQTNNAGQTASFTVAASGTAPLRYQWRGGSSAGSLTNLVYGGGQYSPVTNATLYITNVSSANAGYYAVFISNVVGFVTSSVVTLTINTNTTYQAAIESDHPTSFWPLNETSGTTIHDLVGTNNGTAMNTSGLTFGASGVAGGKAIYFTNADSGYIQVPYSSLLNTPQLTVEVWLNMPTFPVSGAGYNINPLGFDNSSPAGWTFDVYGPNSANPPMYGMLADTSGAYTYDVSGTCIQNQWSYYVMTYNGSTFSVYTNGALAVSASSTYAQVPSGTEFFIGAYNDYGNNTADRFYQGGMERVAVYTNALSSSRILTHWQVGTNSPN